MRYSHLAILLLMFAGLIGSQAWAEPKRHGVNNRESSESREASKLAAERIANNPDAAGEPVPRRLKKLHAVTAKTEYKKKKAQVAELRMDALKVSAFRWGSQEGMYWRYQIILAMLEENSLELHTTADFNKFLVDGKMLLPVISKSERMFQQNNDTSVRTVSVSYTLEKPARLVPQAPTWRDYLIRAVDTPVKPHDALFPRTNVEKVVWADALSRGWQSGAEQADAIFDIDLRRMHADIDGMFRFRNLLAQNIVTLPIYKNSRYNVVKVEDGKTIHLNDIVYEITEQSEFSDTEKWEPYFKGGDK
ncbi:MAG: type IV secretion system DotC family protein [Gammaproteobacteria bacterium]|nr:type IV secretion system DotC family protein [Gammaproteobacteria bacterium]